MSVSYRLAEYRNKVYSAFQNSINELLDIETYEPNHALAILVSVQALRKAQKILHDLSTGVVGY